MFGWIKTGIGILLFIGVAACINSHKQSGEESNKKIGDNLKEYKTKSGKSFNLEIDHSMGASIVGLKVSTSGFTAVNREHDFGNIDPIVMVFLEDLDKNGFEELYIVTRSAGSGSYSNIYGLASNRDKSATPIYVRPISERDRSKGGLFHGFMGHNSFEVKKGRLLNSFPVYIEEDTNAAPGGGIRKIEYRLLAGEAGWILAHHKHAD